MNRIPRFYGRFRRTADRLGAVPGSARGRAVGQTIARLCAAETLPGPGDTRALIPPTSAAWVRRVPGRNLWLWYRPRDGEVVLIALTAEPPVPPDE